jgi:hypothetical protein
VAVATHTEGYTALSEMIGALAFHIVFMFLGMVFTGLGLRKKQAIA